MGQLAEPTEVIDLSDEGSRSFCKGLALEGEVPVEGVARKSYSATKVKMVGDRKLAWIISTAAVDRDNDIVSPKGADWNAWLKGGGPVMWAHNYRIPPFNVPIANGEKVELVEGDKLRSVADFGEAGVFDFGDLIFELARPREGRAPRLKQSSIGFRVLEWTFDEERGGFNIEKYEGLEWSIVPIASNRDALSEVKSFAEMLDGRLTKAWREFAEATLDTLKGPGLWLPREDVEATYRALAKGETVPVPEGVELPEEKDPDAGDQGSAGAHIPGVPGSSPGPATKYEVSASDLDEVVEAAVQEATKKAINAATGRLD